MNFIADGMLGKLTRWLRMLGYNVKYSSTLEDAQLIKIAEKERRILLTRDLELYRQATAKGLNTFYIETRAEEEKLAEVAARFRIKLDMDMARSRCPNCNVKVKPIFKERIVDKVEKSTYAHYDEFWQCPECKQVYWQGAHWKKIRETLEMAKENLERLEPED